MTVVRTCGPRRIHRLTTTQSLLTSNKLRRWKATGASARPGALAPQTLAGQTVVDSVFDPKDRLRTECAGGRQTFPKQVLRAFDTLALRKLS